MCRRAVAVFQALVEPARDDGLLEMRVQHQPLRHRRVVEVQLVVGDATVPIGTTRRAGNVVHRRQQERDRTTRQQAALQVGRRQCNAAAAKVAQRDRQWIARVGKHHPLEPAAHRAAAQGIGRKRAQVSELGAQPTFAPQHMPAAAGEDVQAVARVVQQLVVAAPEGFGQLGAEQRTHLRRRGRLAACMRVVLVDVVVGHVRERVLHVVQAGRGHAPRTDRRPQQVHRVRAGGKPLTEQVLVQRVEHQPLRATGRSGNGVHVLRRQAVLTQVLQRARAGMDTQCFHAGHFIRSSHMHRGDGLKQRARLPE